MIDFLYFFAKRSKVNPSLKDEVRANFTAVKLSPDINFTMKNGEAACSLVQNLQSQPLKSVLKSTCLLCLREIHKTKIKQYFFNICRPSKINKKFTLPCQKTKIKFCLFLLRLYVTSPINRLSTRSCLQNVFQESEAGTI